MRTTILLALLSLSCKDDPPTPPAAGHPLPTAAERAVLAEAGEVFLEGAADPSTARADALAALQGDALVAEAALADDGTSLPVRFASGALGGLATRVMGDEPDLSAIVDATRAPRAVAPTRRLASPAAGPPPATSHKIALITTATEQAQRDDLSQLEDVRQRLLDEHCFDAEDVVLLGNLPEHDYADVTVEDVLDLDAYGMVLFHTPGVVSPHPGGTPRPMIQLGAVDDDTLLEERLVASGALQVWGAPVPASDGNRPYAFLDLLTWSREVDLADGALVVLSTSGGMAAAPGLHEAGAAAVVSFEGAAPGVAGADTAWALPHHLMGGGAGAGIADTLEGYQAILDAFGLSVTLPTLSGASSGDVGLPTWMNVSTDGWPDGTLTVRTTVTYADGSPAPAVDVVEDVKHSPNTFEGLLPGHELIVTAEALDADGRVLATAEERTVLEPGGCNDLVVHLSTGTLAIHPTPATILVGSIYGSHVYLSLWEPDPEDPGASRGVAMAEIEVTTTLGHFQDASDATGRVKVVTTDGDGQADARLFPDGVAGTAELVATATGRGATARAEVRFVDADYVEDFEGVVGAEWQPQSTGALPGGDHYLGPFRATGPTMAGLQDLPPHSWVVVSWDYVFPFDTTEHYTPITFRALSSAWSNGWATVYSSGSSTATRTSVSYRINHHASEISFEWEADPQTFDGVEPDGHEWAIDNFSVRVEE